MTSILRSLSVLIIFIPFSLSGQTINGSSMDAGTGISWNCGGGTAIELGQVTTYGGTGTNFVAEIDDINGLCQTVTGFAAGALYEMRFLSSKNTVCGTTAQQSFDVQISGGVPSFSVVKTNTVFDLAPESFCFMATAASHTFTWVNTTGAGPGFDPACGAVVDEIHLEALGQSNPNFTFADFCINAPTSPVITGVPGGVFTFNPDPLDGATIHSSTGIISAGVPGTTYSVQYTTNADCQINHIETVTVFASPTIQNLTNNCAADQLSYTLTFDVVGGDGAYGVTGITGTFAGNTFTTDPIPNGTSYNISVNDGNNCAPANILGSVNCTCSATAELTGNDFSICPTGDADDLIIEFTGTGPWNYTIAADGVDLFTAIANVSPFNLSTSAGGTFTLTSVVDDNGCVASVSGETIITEYTNILIDNVETQCTPDQLSYVVTFDITGGDPSSYVSTGDPGNINGSVFTSDPIPAGTPYDFTITDINDCAPVNEMGASPNDCNCDVTAAISGNIDICPGTTGNLSVGIVGGTAPWTFVYAIDLIPQPPVTTSDDTYSLPVTAEGSYTLVSIEDFFCSGNVFGNGTVVENTSPVIDVATIVETCSADQLTYTVTFEINGGDQSTYDFTLASDIGGTITGNTFTSGPLPGGSTYFYEITDDNDCNPTSTGNTVICNCLAEATISGNEGLCLGDSVAVMIDFIGGPGPWTFDASINGADLADVTTSDNPYLLYTFSTGTYLLDSIMDNTGCYGTTSGTATVFEFDSPVISNIEADNCELDQLNYTVTFDVTGGDVASYINVGSTIGGTFTGGSFVSDPIPTGTPYQFIVTDTNDCIPDTITGPSPVCTCSAFAVINGNIDICPGVPGDITVGFGLGTPPYSFTYNDGAGVDITIPPTFDNPYIISTSTPGTYSLVTMSDVNCTGSVFATVATVTEYTSPVISNVVETCALDQLSYVVTFDVTGGDVGSYVQTGDAGVLAGTVFTSAPIASGDPYSFTYTDINDCNPATVNGVVNCSCSATAALSGDIDVCPGVNGNLIVDFVGAGPWTFSYSIDLGPDIDVGPTLDNPYLLPTSTVGTYTITQMSDVNCVGSVSGTGTVTELTSPVISNVVETCSLDQLTYTVTFDVTGGDTGTYVNSGDPGAIVGGVFTSTAIPSGNNYSFTVTDVNDCNPASVNGVFNCSCDATATLSGDIDICPGACGDLTVDFTGPGPWSFEYSIDAGPAIPIPPTLDNPYTLSACAPGTYTLTTMSDVNCVGSVSGTATVTEFTSPVISNVVETCAPDQLSYIVTFDVTGGDVGSYVQTGDAGVLAGTVFTSAPIASGDPYSFTYTDINDCNPATVSGLVNCSCSATATLSSDIDICPGACGDLTIDFTGPGPWTFSYSIDAGPAIPIPPTLDNPYILSACAPGTYTLTTMSDANCVGSISGIVTVTELTSPIISNVVETCSLDQLTYTVTFDITGGDPGTYVSSGDPGAIVGGVFTSTAIPSGNNYSFTVTDVNNCNPASVNGVFSCSCDATATLSGNIDICPGMCGDLTVDFTGPGPWTFDYSIDAGPAITVPPTFDNPYLLSACASGTYTLTTMSDVNCVGSVFGSVTVTEYSVPTISNVVETCALDQLTYTVSFDVTGGDVGSYMNVGDGGTFAGNIFTSFPIPTGDNYSFSVSDMNGCDPAIETGVVNCVCLATATLSGDIDVCPGECDDLTIDFTGPGPWSFVYLIDGINPVPVVDTPNNPYLLSACTPGTYSLASMSDVNCVGSVSGTATVTELTSPVISNVVVTCSADLLTYTVTFNVTGGDPSTYVNNGTSGGGFVGSTFTSSNITSLIPYNFVITDDNDCSPDVLDGIGDCTCYVTATVSGDATICEGESTDIIFDLADGPDQGPWDLTYAYNNIPQPTIPGITTTPYVLSVTEPGVYTVETISTDFCTGTMSGSATIVVNPLPTASINGNFSICAGDQHLIPVVLTGTGPWSFDYTVDGIAQPTIVTALSPFEIVGTLEGEYVITNVTDGNICSNTGDGVANITFLSDLMITFPNDPGICIGETATILAEGNTSQNFPYDYVWSTNNLVSSNDSIAIYNPLTDIDVQVTVSDGCNTESYTISIVVNELPPVAISGDVTLCGPDFVGLNNATPNNFVGSSCLWSVNGDTINNCTTFDYFYDVGVYDVNLQVTSPEGCTNNATFVNQVTILPQAEADFSYSPDVITTLEPEVQFINESSPDVTFWDWNFGDIGESGEQDPSFIFPVDEGPQNWLTCLFVDNDFGCSDSICEIISIEGDLVLLIPNTFTPDGDSVNEFFYPILIGADREDFSFTIYNRYGLKVFHTTDIDEKWNGSLKYPYYYAPDGMYSWQVFAKIEGSSEIKEFTGSVLIMR